MQLGFASDAGGINLREYTRSLPSNTLARSCNKVLSPPHDSPPRCSSKGNLAERALNLMVVGIDQRTTSGAMARTAGHSHLRVSSLNRKGTTSFIPTE